MVGAWCRAGWIATRTTALCLRFDSPTLGPRFLIPRPIVLLSGRVTLHQVMSQHVGSHHSMLGHITARWVMSQRIRSHHIALRCITSGQVRLHCIGSRHIALGHIALHWVVSHCIGLCRIALGCVALHWVTSHQSRYYRVALHYYQPYLVHYPSLLLFHSFARSSPPLPAKV